MTPEEALLNYLYPRINEALQTWKGFDDIYGVWIILSLYEDSSEKPSFSHLRPLRTSFATSERIQSYFGNRFDPGVADYTADISFEFCADPWPSLEERDNYYDTDDFQEGDPEGLQLREEFFMWKRAQLSHISPSDSNYPELSWFLEICGALIRRLHADGTLVSVCGKAVSIGISFSNDVNEEVALPVTRDNNPERLSKGMEECMLGKTYEQIERETAFRAELRTRPVEEQAKWWLEAIRGFRGWMQDKATTPEWEDAQREGFTGLHPDWEGIVATPLAERIVSEAEMHLEVLPQQEPSVEQDFANFLLMEFFGLESHPELQANIQDTVVMRLQILLQRLHDAGKTQEKVGSALQLIARALRALRPERFPEVGWNRTGHLLEPEAFGLK